MKSFTDVARKWPSDEEYGVDLGVTRILARYYRNANTLPPGLWLRAIKMAEKRNYRGVTLKSLAKFAENNRLSK